MADDPWHVYAKMRLGTLFIGDSHENIVCDFRISCHETEDDLRALRNAEAIVAAHNGDAEMPDDELLLEVMAISDRLRSGGQWNAANTLRRLIARCRRLEAETSPPRSQISENHL